MFREENRLSFKANGRQTGNENGKLYNINMCVALTWQQQQNKTRKQQETEPSKKTMKTHKYKHINK